MSSTLDEIGKNLLENLKVLSCPPLLNVLNIESNKTIKDILIDSVYLEEKLNLFIWLILSFEPKLTADFSDVEFCSAENKCRKVIDGLSFFGIVDVHEFGIDRLLNTNLKNSKELLLILNDLCNLLQNKMNSQSLHSDEIFSLELISSAPIQSNEGDYLNENIYKKSQILDDINFFKEYNAILNNLNTSTIPSDVNRIIRKINETSPFYSNNQLEKNFKKEELMEFIQKENLTIESQIEQLNQTLSVFELVNLEDGRKRDSTEIMNEYKKELSITKNSLKELNLFFENLTKNSYQSNSANQVADSNFGKSFYDMSIVYNQFKKFKTCLTDWSTFFKTHSERLDAFRKSNLIDQENFEIKQNFNQQIKDCTDLIGQSSSTQTSNPKTIKLNANLNETVVDQLLLL